MLLQPKAVGAAAKAAAVQHTRKNSEFRRPFYLLISPQDTSKRPGYAMERRSEMELRNKKGHNEEDDGDDQVETHISQVHNYLRNTGHLLPRLKVEKRLAATRVENARIPESNAEHDGIKLETF
ncbi:hypothetical protein PRIPAC_79395 [Pristionchus pacificus]|uniref:Uncharacterized protein n=1 Tax=Pristionchus pacificus TaxID=54126 RepID=A0A2A6BXY0_PRIPA|nr:hypothetical protein PRIPAC_79395 [Pristionchus pacificus]|eukprot:PDM70862.1 hypothetical protein PRIPAC_45066 [Pristionchus pacificus]